MGLERARAFDQVLATLFKKNVVATYLLTFCCEGAGWVVGGDKLFSVLSELSSECFLASAKNSQNQVGGIYKHAVRH